MRRTILFILILAALAGLVAFGRFVIVPKYVSQVTPKASPQATPSPVFTKPIWSTSLTDEERTKLEGVFDQLSTRAKVAQLVAYPLTLTGKNVLASSPSIATTATASESTQLKTPASAAEVLMAVQPGFITYFGQHISLATAQATSDVLRSGSYTRRAAASSSEEKKDLYIPPFIAVDHEGGTVQRLNGLGFTQLPSWQKLCAGDVVVRAEQLNQSAREVRAAGVHFVFGPVIDVASKSATLKERVCSSDPNDVSDNASMWTRIFRKVGVTSVLKHYPGIGDTTVDLHREANRIFIDQVQRSIYFDLLKTLPLGVMTSHVGILSQGASESDGLPCSLSATCLAPLRALDPAPLIFTDALEMQSAQLVEDSGSNELQKSTTPSKLVDVAEGAILAGNDVLVFGPTVKNDEFVMIVNELTKRAENSPQLRQRIDESMRKILERKFFLL